MASDTATTYISVPVLLWVRLLRELRRRGAGRRESGAFLLGHRPGGVGHITVFVCYDDLDPNAYQSGAIAFHADGYAALWERCRKSALQVIGDVHTHPEGHISQSEIDQRHPMIPVVGHTAIIVPNFARTPWWSLRAVGVYEYCGNFEWRTHCAPQHRRRMRLTLW